MPGKDVAILKIETPFELPVIELAKSNEVPVGEEIFVYGYPNPVSNNEYLSEESVLEPTLTKGIISAWKKTVNGWPVLQMDAGINHGNSGGPEPVKGINVLAFVASMIPPGLAAGLNFMTTLIVQRIFDSGDQQKSLIA
jgi:S1-C subfamily serine protease